MTNMVMLPLMVLVVPDSRILISMIFLVLLALVTYLVAEEALEEQIMVL